MRPKEYDSIHRRYYHDHPTSLNHNEPYMVPLQNQYSVLNQARNPYHVLDHLNLQMSKKYPTAQSRMDPIAFPQEQSLDNEMRSWNTKQTSKDRDYQNMKYELKDLSNMLKRKEDEYEREKMSNQFKSMMMNQSKMMPSYPMMMGGMGMGGMGCGNGCGGHGCQAQSQCRCQRQQQCQCQCRCSCQRGTAIPRPQQKRYKASITQNSPIRQATPPPPVKKSQSTIKSMMLSVKSSKPMIKSEPKLDVKPVTRLSKQRRSNLLRRFRVCVYAVYFCIYFKWFSFQLSLNRYNRFKLKYLVDSGKKITLAYKEVYARLLSIDIPRLIRSAADSVPEQNQNNQRVDISTLLKVETAQKFESMSHSFSLLSSDKETLFLRCEEFISLLFEEMETIFGDWDWEEHGQALTVGAVNQTFMLDNYFLPHELFMMRFHEKKGYAKIQPKHERTEIMIKIVVKMLLFNVCLQLDNNREWHQQNGEDLKEQGDGDQVFMFLEISSKIIFVICQQLYEKVLEGQVSNYAEVSDRFKVEPCNPLVYSYSIRKRRELFKKEEVKDSNLLIFGIENLDQVNQIASDVFFRQSRLRIANCINSLVDQVLSKLKDTNRLHYEDLWKQTLDNEYIVLRGMKKIMKSTRLYPFISNSVIFSKKHISNKNYEDQIDSTLTGKKPSARTITNNSDITSKTSFSNSTTSKISIQKRIRR